MDPQTYSATAGESLTIGQTVVDEAGAAVNISGATVHCSLARRPGGTVVAGTDESPTSITASVTDGPNGVLEVVIPKSLTITLLGTYYWHIDTEDGAGDQATVAHGFITFRPHTAHA